jgi:hypothetical protein
VAHGAVLVVERGQGISQHGCDHAIEAAAFIIVAAAEGVALTASPEFYAERGADELATLFTRYLTGGPTHG